MAIGSCTSCTPLTDTTKLAINPKADINGDGKLTSTELQRSKLIEDVNVSEVKGAGNEGNSTSDNNYNSNKKKQDDTYVSSLKISPLSPGNILLLALNQRQEQ